MGDIQHCFEDWYMSFPDYDESLLEDKKEDGERYNDKQVDLMWFCFKSGFCYGQLS